jgi:hypothetical protein
MAGGAGDRCGEAIVGDAIRAGAAAGVGMAVGLDRGVMICGAGAGRVGIARGTGTACGAGVGLGVGVGFGFGRIGGGSGVGVLLGGKLKLSSPGIVCGVGLFCALAAAVPQASAISNAVDRAPATTDLVENPTTPP